MYCARYLVETSVDEKAGKETNNSFSSQTENMLLHIAYSTISENEAGFSLNKWKVTIVPFSYKDTLTGAKNFFAAYCGAFQRP